MRRLSLLLFGILLGGGLVFLAFHYHMVRTAQGVLIVPKAETSLADPYTNDSKFCFLRKFSRSLNGMTLVPAAAGTNRPGRADIRDWTPQDWSEHPELIHSLMADGRGNLVQQSVSEGLLRDLFQNPNRHASPRNRL